MPMTNFFQTFPKLAGSELRNFTIGPGPASTLPEGRYSFVEFYCGDRDCDCRRVLIAVYSEKENEYVAHISMAFDSGKQMAGPFLDPLGPQRPYAPELLDFFTAMINTDPAYVERLQRHYVQFKERVDRRPYAGRSFEPAGGSERIATTWMANRPLTAPARREVRAGRNDPCPCGSGKKYKRCCLGKPLKVGQGNAPSGPQH